MLDELSIKHILSFIEFAKDLCRKMEETGKSAPKTNICFLSIDIMVANSSPGTFLLQWTMKQNREIFSAQDGVNIHLIIL